MPRKIEDPHDFPAAATVILSVRIPVADYSALKARAVQSGKSMGFWVREALDQWLSMPEEVEPIEERG